MQDKTDSENITRSDLGFDSWFQDQMDAVKAEAHEIARVTSVHRESYQINRGGGDVFAEASGKLLYSADSPLDLPAVGDWVYADFFDDDSHAIIHECLPRKNALRRKTAGKSVDFQLIAVNLDRAFIVQSLDHDFNLRRLERYLVMVRENGIPATVLLGKSDRVTQHEIDERENSIRELMPQLQIIVFSSVSGDGLEEIRALFKPAQTFCLLGSSGVGKSTLLNTLNQHTLQATAEVREKDSKGRHTTTHRELFRLEGGAFLIDTPGMRELGAMSVEQGIEDTFADIEALAEQCRFADCTHTNEAGCAIQAALESGELSGKRYQNYLSMKKESAFNEMSWLEKKRKDKAFGKHVKSVMKQKKRR